MTNSLYLKKYFYIFLFINFIFFLEFKHKKIFAKDLIKDKKIKKESNLKEAMFYEKLKDKKVKCNLCPRGCVLKDGESGFCRVRQNIEGTLYSLNYSKVAAINIDPIEKKPFFHFLPGTKAFSVACPGCNLRCKYCQNWDISQRGASDSIDRFLSPKELVDAALKSGAKSIAYTYSEPTVFYEYVIDSAKLAREKGLKNVVVTSGFINPEPLKELIKYVDAFKIDLKGFNEGFYLKYTSGGLKPVLESLKVIKNSKRHIEIVNLVIPGANDSEEDIRSVSKWIKENLGPEIPVHFTRFYPNYLMTQTPPTSKNTLIVARKIAMDEGLKYVYTGNIDNPEGETTYCPGNKIAIERRGFFLLKNNLNKGKCPDGTKIYGVFE